MITAEPSPPGGERRSVIRLALPGDGGGRTELRLKLRSKLVVAMLFAALVPAMIVALLATGVILSSLETALREDAERQLVVGLNLILRSIERLGDETAELSESAELGAALASEAALDSWLAHVSAHVPSARLQLFSAEGQPRYDRVVWGAEDRFDHSKVWPGDPVIATGQQLGRGVSLVARGERVVVRAVSPIVDSGLTLKGVLVLSMPLDADFADSIKGALTADVMVGGPSGVLETTFRPGLGPRTEVVQLADADRVAALSGQRVIRTLDVAAGEYLMAATALIDRRDQPIGVLAVAVDRAPLTSTKRLAVRSLIAGEVAALAFALVLALFWSRRLGSPIVELHRGAIAVSRGDLDHRIDIPGGDELTDLATAFNQMTSTLQDNQARLAARMREIVALHDAGRAVSSVIDVESVSRKIVDAVARTVEIQLAALWLVDHADHGAGHPTGALRVTAARARRADVSAVLATDDALAAGEALRPIAEAVYASRRPLRLDRASSDPAFGDAAIRAGAPGPLVALPLDRQTRVVGVLVVGRAERAGVLTDADLSLLTTFADQAGAAVDNALLYSEVREHREELEKKVELRTIELTATNRELGRALDDLRETQAQLVLSERMAGLGLLVASVAHEINSPSAAIRGSIDGLAGALVRVSQHTAELAARAAPASVAAALEALAPVLAERALPTSLTARRTAREIATALEAMPGAPVGEPLVLAAELADLGATPDESVRLIDAVGPERRLACAVAAALTDHVYLHRTASTVRHAVASIQRIVGALKSYSHLDHQAIRTEADVHEGLETTLALLHHALRDIVVERRFAALPRVPVYVDELNQVWTNLIQNAQQALSGRPGGEPRITIETVLDGGWAVVRVTDNGPGVPADLLPRIFEPFFTTKRKGDGTGLGLGIARQIVHKHGGAVRCESQPGRTQFEVRLPIAGGQGEGGELGPAGGVRRAQVE